MMALQEVILTLIRTLIRLYISFSNNFLSLLLIYIRLFELITIELCIVLILYRRITHE